MQRTKVLFISDDPDTEGVWEFALRQMDVTIFHLSPGELEAEWLSDRIYDLILIDEKGRNFDSIALIHKWRAEINIPIILMTGGDYTRCLEAYRVGVDECCNKPLSPDMLVAKIKAWLRHSTTVPIETLNSVERGPFRLHPLAQEVVANGSRVGLTNLEYRLLHLLLSHTNQVIPTQVLIDRVWNYPATVDSTSLKNVVYRLRRKLEPDPANPEYIISVTGEGYMFKM